MNLSDAAGTVARKAGASEATARNVEHKAADAASKAKEMGARGLNAMEQQSQKGQEALKRDMGSEAPNKTRTPSQKQAASQNEETMESIRNRYESLDEMPVEGGKKMVDQEYRRH